MFSLFAFDFFNLMYRDRTFSHVQQIIIVMQRQSPLCHDCCINWRWTLFDSEYAFAETYGLRTNYRI